MAERIVSPGVFTRERDLSFLPQSIGEIGAAIIGPTKLGPAFTPTQITSFQEFEELFGGIESKFYTPYTVEQYLQSAGVVTVVRVLGIGGYQAHTLDLIANSVHTRSLAVLAPSRGGSGAADLSKSIMTGDSKFNKFHLTVSGSGILERYTGSFDTGSNIYVDKVFSTNPNVTTFGGRTTSVYLYKQFPDQGHALFGSASLNDGGSGVAGQPTASVVADSTGLDFAGGSTSFDAKGNASTYSGNKDYSTARTPYIQSQPVDGISHVLHNAAEVNNLFRIYTRSHGTAANTQYKIHILNIKASTVSDQNFGTFSIQVVRLNPGEANDGEILEQFDGLSFDPLNPDFFAKRIGDRHITIDSNGKLTYFGNYDNKSLYIRVGDYVDMVEDTTFKLPETMLPFGFEAINNVVKSRANTGAGSGSFVPTGSFVESQVNDNNVFDENVFFGFDFSKLGNREMLAPVPNGAQSAGNDNRAFNLNTHAVGNADASRLVGAGESYSGTSEIITLSGSAIEQKKFAVPFQWGFDGMNPATPSLTGTDIANTNTQGFDLSSAEASGTLAYKRAINAVSNPDEFDINLLVTPGVIHRLHSNVTNHAISKVEARADALFIMDAGDIDDSINTVIDAVDTLDTNYVATYYPWVKLVDSRTQVPVFVPPSVVLPGVLAFNDSVSHEWFAPAGLNRGGLAGLGVTEAKTRLTHAERDRLYEGRINPIASFPSQGVVVFGQKTLQSKPSALDRINVRRLLIALRKFIASASQFLVFEQNTAATRNRFLNIVNPYLEQVQQNSGLSAFRVVMDDTNNTADVVDRNQLVGQIFIQPTRTAEFIVLDFVVQPTGATFPE